MKTISPNRINTIRPKSNQKGLNICILARKRLYRNTRVVRQAKVLLEAGHDVTVVALEIPAPELREQTPGARYILVELNPFIRRVLIKLNKLGSWPYRTRIKIRNFKAKYKKKFFNFIHKTKQISLRFFRKTTQNILKQKRFLAKFFSSQKNHLFRTKNNLYGFINRLIKLKNGLSPKSVDPGYNKNKFKRLLVNTARFLISITIRLFKFMNLICKVVSNLYKKLILKFIKPLLSFVVTVFRLPYQAFRKLILHMTELSKHICKFLYKSISRVARFLFSSVKTITKILLRPFVWILRFFKRAANFLFNAIAHHLVTFKDKASDHLRPAMSLSNSVDFAKKSASILTIGKFDICQAHDTYSLLAADKLRKRDNALIIYDALEIDDDRSSINIASINDHWAIKTERHMNATIIKKADLVLGVGPSLATWTQERYNLTEPVKVIRNCSIFQPQFNDCEMKRDLGLGPNDRLGVVIGSIYHNQGFEQLIDALQHMPVNIHIAGLGPSAAANYIEGLLADAKEKGVSDRFHILPPQEPQNLIRYASGSDIGIISRQNTCLNNELSMPNKVFELIMSRLPIASSRLPDIAGLVQQYDIGLIFDETDPKDMALVISEMLSSDTLNRMKSAINNAAEELCWENESMKYLSAVETLAKQHNKMVM